jgi:hypothetical protein
MPSLIILLGAAAVIFEIVRVSPNAARDAYNTIQEFTDPKHEEGDPLNINQRAIVERYSATYSKIQLSSLEGNERFVANQIAKHKRDQRWLRFVWLPLAVPLPLKTTLRENGTTLENRSKTSGLDHIR